MSYFARLSAGRIVLWCYLIWYVFFVTRYFDPSPTLWVTSLGLSGIIGIALLINTWNGGPLKNWQTFRLFLTPFCVSSFASVVKGRGFILVFSPHGRENLLALGCCAAFCAIVAMIRWIKRDELMSQPTEKDDELESASD